MVPNLMPLSFFLFGSLVRFSLVEKGPRGDRDGVRKKTELQAQFERPLKRGLTGWGKALKERERPLHRGERV